MYIRTPFFVGALCAIITLGACFVGKPLPSTSPASAIQLLNSERIAKKFGNYEVEVLPESDGKVRISNLHSIQDGRKICRTFAITFFANNLHPSLAKEHTLITEKGQSIGAVFKANGYEVRKRTRYIGSFDNPQRRILQLMHDNDRSSLAMYIYDFSVAKDGTELPYATIVEIYHADYLREQNIKDIYGDQSGSRGLNSDSADTRISEIIAKTRLIASSNS